MFKWPGRPRKTLLGGSLRYQFVFLNIRIFKTCSYRMELRRCDRWRCLKYFHLDCDWHYIWFNLICCNDSSPKSELIAMPSDVKAHFRSPIFHAHLQSPLRLYSRYVRVRRMQVSGWWPIKRLATCTEDSAALYHQHGIQLQGGGETNGNNWTKHNAMIPSPEYQIQY